jgi:type IV pilus assembly protein PilV
MNRNNFTIRRQRGFNLIEVMVSVLVMSLGIVGMAGTQITAKRVGHEAVQRTTASNLALDILERIRANPQVLSNYASSGLGGSTISTEPSPNCSDSGSEKCTAAQLAAHDLWEWEQAIDGASAVRDVGGSDVFVGGLIQPTACITVGGGTVTVAVAWKGYQILSNPTSHACGSGAGKYGSGDDQRQVLVMNTFVTDA